jgi:hypothetical protein
MIQISNYVLLKKKKHKYLRLAATKKCFWCLFFLEHKTKNKLQLYT